MNEDEVKQRVDSIIAAGDDPEDSHIQEDDLGRDLIHAYCPDWVIQQINRLRDADLERWYA